jgi:2,4-dienoyl-CoA reductase-like NADH-dependent reductase (Old Yellow Enzyme family)
MSVAQTVEKKSNRYPRIASFKTQDDFAAYVASLGLELPFDREISSGAASPLAQPYQKGGLNIGNRFAILPMEGWDGEADGKPSDLTLRRWKHFGLSGAKLIWGGEAVAVRHDGRANPNQVVLKAENEPAIAELLAILRTTHQEYYHTTNDLLIGLQLTHSGRFSRPNTKERLEPFILYRHPYIEKRYPLAVDYPVATDTQIEELISDFVTAAVRAQKLGFNFVDIKHCHGYLGHEFLTAVDRPGRYGGSFENRTRFLREIVAGIRRDAPGLAIGVRLSAFDTLPYQQGEDGRGQPVASNGASYPYAFGAEPGDPLKLNLAETVRFLELLQNLDIRLVCLTAGSPYYNPHIQRPALFPPSDGYQPPEDPLVGVARQVQVVAQLKTLFPDLALVGSGYSYLQEQLAGVAQYNVRCNRVDFIGLGRLVLSYPQFPADIITGKPLQTKLYCRTFSECTTAPRNGMISGCFPLDPFYKARPEAKQVKLLLKAQGKDND